MTTGYFQMPTIFLVEVVVVLEASERRKTRLGKIRERCTKEGNYLLPRALKIRQIEGADHFNIIPFSSTYCSRFPCRRIVFPKSPRTQCP